MGRKQGISIFNSFANSRVPEGQTLRQIRAAELQEQQDASVQNLIESSAIHDALEVRADRVIVQSELPIAGSNDGGDGQA